MYPYFIFLRSSACGGGHLELGRLQKLFRYWSNNQLLKVSFKFIQWFMKRFDRVDFKYLMAKFSRKTCVVVGKIVFCAINSQRKCHQLILAILHLLQLLLCGGDVFLNHYQACMWAQWLKAERSSEPFLKLETYFNS